MKPNYLTSSPRAFPVRAAAVATSLLLPGIDLAAQEEIAVPGVALGLVYETSYLPPLAIMPFEAAGADEADAGRAHSVVARDLDYSDRFAIIDSLPADLSQGVDYGLWDGLGVDWVLTGTLELVGARYELALELHDIVFASVTRRGRFPVPRPDSKGFRMAVHRASDAVVEWVTGDPGPAASRIIFSMRPYGDPVNKELYVVDWDGENLLRLTWDENTVASPAWSPDARHVAYTSWKSGVPQIYEISMADQSERVLEPGREGQQITPAYHPGGELLAFSLLGRGRSGLFSYNLATGCCLSQMGGGRYNDLQPTFSPDGDQVAFTSNRLGAAVPQIYIMPADGGEARLLSPYRFGEGGYFADPDWSPRGDQVAFAGRVKGSRSRYHILVADVRTGDGRLTQLTRDGDNQDPSWAPDGRHIVFTGERSYGFGIFVVDAGTGRTRSLVSNVRAEDPDWSPSLRGFEDPPP